MYNLETNLIIALLGIYPLIFITRPKEIAAGETQDEVDQRFKENNIAVIVFTYFVMSGVIFNATFY